jgi:hypothetical protein
MEMRQEMQMEIAQGLSPQHQQLKGKHQQLERLQG